MKTDSDPALMPVELLVEQAIGDISSDYNDGDHPGYYRQTYDALTGELRLFYEPDTDPDLEEEYQPAHMETTATFRLVDVSTGRLHVSQTEQDVRGRYQEQLNDGEDHPESIVRVLRDLAATDPTERALGFAVRVLLAIEDGSHPEPQVDIADHAAAVARRIRAL